MTAFLSPSEILKQGSRFVPGGAAVAGPLFLGGAVVIGAGIRSAAKVKQKHTGLRIHAGRARASKDEIMPRYRKPSSAGNVHGFFQHQQGDLYGLVRPGWNWVAPVSHGMEVISTANSTIDLKNFALNSATGRQHEIDAQLTIGVVEELDENFEAIDYGIEYPELVYRALMAARNIDEMAKDIAGMSTESLRMILQEKPRPDVVRGPDIQPVLVRNIGAEVLSTYGVEIRRLSIIAAGNTPADILRNGPMPQFEAIGAGSNGHLPSNGYKAMEFTDAAAIIPGFIPGLSPPVD